jgi:GTP cyclohydrolase II
MKKKAILTITRIIGELKRGYGVVLDNHVIFSPETFSFNTGDLQEPKLIVTEKRLAALQDVQKVNLLRLPDQISGLEPFAASTELENLAIKLVRFAELLPMVIISQPQGKEELMLNCSASDIAEYEQHINHNLDKFIEAPLCLENAEDSRIFGYRALDTAVEHYAIIIGHPERDPMPLIRIHSSCYTGDLLASLKCDCGPQLKNAIEFMGGQENGGVILYLMQEGRGIGLASKLRTYELQAKGLDTVEANEFLGYENDERSMQPAKAILDDLGFTQIRLISNNPRKKSELEKGGIKVKEIVSLQMNINKYNVDYLKTKALKSGHQIDFTEKGDA